MYATASVAKIISTRLFTILHLPPPVKDKDRANSNDVETGVHHQGHNDGHHIARTWEKEGRPEEGRRGSEGGGLSRFVNENAIQGKSDSLALMLMFNCACDEDITN